MGPYDSLVRHLEDLLTSVTREFGRGTQAQLLITYEYLLTLLDVAAKDHSHATELKGLVYHLAREVQRAHSAAQPPAPPAGWCFREGVEPRLRFSSALFAHHYADRAREIERELIVLDPTTAPALRELVPYIYVVDVEGRVVVWDQPLRLDQIVLARDPVLDPDRVTHPMLVPRHLTVLCAGELIIIRSEQGLLRTVLANTRSGHFRPPPCSAQHLRRALRNRLRLPASSSVLIFKAFDDSLEADPFSEEGSRCPITALPG